MMEIVSLRQQQGMGEKPALVDEPAPEKEEEEREVILCGYCHHRVAHPSDRIEVHGAHRHTFANPQGLIFEIGCFRQAEGCRYSGEPSAEWSWFGGFRWRIALCGRCLTQLGWLFVSSAETRFAGLILDRLVFPG